MTTKERLLHSSKDAPWSLKMESHLFFVTFLIQSNLKLTWPVLYVWLVLVSWIYYQLFLCTSDWNNIWFSRNVPLILFTPIFNFACNVYPSPLGWRFNRKGMGCYGPKWKLERMAMGIYWYHHSYKFWVYVLRSIKDT